MHDNHSTQPREKSGVIFFLLATVLGCYLIYVAVMIPYEMGVQQGAIKAAYKPAKATSDDGERVFDQRQLYNPTPDLVALGKAVYNQNCASCHGPEGQGDGSAGRNLAIKPRNFHGAISDWKVGASTLAMYETLDKGVAPAMPAFPALNPEQRYAVIHFIHAEYMAGLEIPADDPEAIAALPGPTESLDINIDPYKETRVSVDYAIMKRAGQLPR